MLSAVLGFALATSSARASTPANEFRARPFTFTTATITGKAPEGAPRCTTSDCARRALDAGAVVRLTGEFGSFSGKVASWGADSLSGFRSFPDTTLPSPTSGLGWSQIQRVDQRVGHGGRYAAWGALIGGVLGVAIPLVVYSLQDDTSDVGAFPVVGLAFTGSVLGAFTGASIGTGRHEWKYIYEQP